MPVLAIDAGTTRFKTAVLTTSGEPQSLTNRMGQIFTESVVFFSEDGSVLIGTEAANAALADPTRAVFDWKVNMGTDEVLYSANEMSYTAKGILTILLKEVKNDAEAKTGGPVEEVVITVPANYSNIQKQQTIEAAEAAGLKVLLMPHEPTAGALGNKVYKLQDATVLVFDLGGGTFDVSIIKVKGNVSEIIATGGISELGGRDFNKRIKEHIIGEFERQHGYCPDEDNDALFYQDLDCRVEQLKISLSAQTKCNIVLTCRGDVINMSITRDQFESLVMDLVEQAISKTEETLREAELDWADIAGIYPIGGGAMMPAVIRRLEEASGKKVIQNCEAHCAAALGAAVAGRLEYERQGKTPQVGSVKLPPIGFYTSDILSRAVGVMALDEHNQGICCEILGKKTPMPSLQSRRFKLSELEQTEVRIQILQGEEGQATEDCSDLGYFDLKNLPVRPDIINRIEVVFDIDKNGMLTASARDVVSNIKGDLQVEYKAA